MMYLRAYLWAVAFSLSIAGGLGVTGIMSRMEPSAATTLPVRAAQSKLVYPGVDGRLIYKPYNDRGDTIPDFSLCGYRRGDIPIPSVSVVRTLTPQPGTGDDFPRLQAALHEIAKLPRDKNGFRGALLLKKGTYRLSDSLIIAESGIVLRGEGSGENGTLLFGTSPKQYVLVEIKGKARGAEQKETEQKITEEYVSVGAKTVTVAEGTAFRPGDTVIVRRQGNAAWIREIGMDKIVPRPTNPIETNQWKPFVLNFDRVITAVEGNRLTLDAPITCAIESRWGGGEVLKYTNERIENVGIENLAGACIYDANVKAKIGDKEYLSDEKHAKRLVSFDNVQHAWARNLSARILEGVALMNGGAKWITVQDCQSTDPISILTGSRRYTYDIEGAQLVLVQRCTARDARHAFVVGARVCGPNVFKDCQSESDQGTSEPHHRWSVGGLYDNVNARIAIQDRQWMGTGHGWSGANYIAWNCRGSLIIQQPPTAQNFAIGFVGTKGKPAFERPAGWWESEGTPVEPRSLYEAQHKDRVAHHASSREE